jgi:2-C-methyl-D-erythritol 2,4-cyclodiphosphate synthase
MTDGEPGLEGHSDGDVVRHALVGALLGAAALGDLGSHFPDTDPGPRMSGPRPCWDAW